MSKLSEILEIIEAGGEWAHGGRPEEVAIEWRETGLSVEEISDWLAVGCFRAEAAFALDNEGITPDQASLRMDDYTVAYWVSNGDMSIREAKYTIDNAND